MCVARSDKIEITELQFPERSHSGSLGFGSPSQHRLGTVATYPANTEPIKANLAFACGQQMPLEESSSAHRWTV
jgi:hypothetical protein